MVADALAAEKPSFNRGTDGRTPFGVPSFRNTMDALESEAMACSSRGEYGVALTTFSQIETVKKQEAFHRREVELKRQGAERGKLDAAYRIEKERFEEEWAGKMAEVEERGKLKVEELEQLHEIGIADLEREIAKTIKGMRYKASSALLGLEDIERRLALAKEFDQAAEMAARSRRRRKVEEATHQRKVDAQGTQPRAALLAAQAEELRNVQQKLHGWRVEVKRQKGQALEIVQQRFRNLEADQSHAHAIEFSLQPEIGPVQTHKSRSSQASTFRGTLKHESLAGTKFDVPDVSKMKPI